MPFRLRCFFYTCQCVFTQQTVHLQNSLVLINGTDFDIKSSYGSTNFGLSVLDVYFADLQKMDNLPSETMFELVIVANLTTYVIN